MDEQRIKVDIFQWDDLKRILESIARNLAGIQTELSEIKGKIK